MLKKNSFIVPPCTEFHKSSYPPPFPMSLPYAVDAASKQMSQQALDLKATTKSRPKKERDCTQSAGLILGAVPCRARILGLDVTKPLRQQATAHFDWKGREAARAG